MKSNRSRRSTRIKACELAAQVMRHRDSPEPLAPQLWSLCVFFECYINDGANATAKPFGPKKPKKLKIVRGGKP